MSILTDISSGAVGGLLGGVGQLAKDIRQAITGDLPAEKQAEITQKLMELENSAMAAQTTINLEEAKSEHLFVSGWRPFIGWTCGAGLAYVSVIEPFLSWIARLCGSTVIFPVIDTTITMQVLIGMLGLGAYRSYDKKNATGKGGV
jgi:hypothetical protein